MNVTSTKLHTDLRWIKVFRSAFEHNGNTGEWLFVSRKKEQTPEEKSKADAVVIIPILEGDVMGAKVILTKEFRVPLQDYEVGFPAGLLDDGEDPLECAKRELLEETGYEVKDHLLTSPPIYSSAGITDESVQLVFVTVGEKLDAAPEPTEDIEVIEMNSFDVLRLLDPDEDPADKPKIGAKAYPILFMLSMLSISSFVEVIKIMDSMRTRAYQMEEMISDDEED